MRHFRSVEAELKPKFIRGLAERRALSDEDIKPNVFAPRGFRSHLNSSNETAARSNLNNFIYFQFFV
jgi:hypothetical protein